MSKTLFLYGASVVGIQQFIFQTDKLKDIAGASELVHQICTHKFYDVVSGRGKYDEEAAIVNAAGNIRYLFDDEQLCRAVVRDFPREVVSSAPGVSVCQAVVEMNDGYEEASKKLETILKSQRNRNMRSMSVGLIGIERCRRTGLPVVAGNSGEHIDEGSAAKINAVSLVDLCKKSFGIALEPGQVPYDVGKLKWKDSWIAVIHADGNGLGQIVRKIGRDKDRFRTFSRSLDDATVKSANAAFNGISDMFDMEKIIPIRPVVLGGDDLTVICRADLAIPYVTRFLRCFEENTKGIVPAGTFEDEPEKNSLTACAGIAFIKSSYPFHYGYELAEALCDVAKKDAKNSEAIRNGRALPMSCFAFHREQGSYTCDYSETVRRELCPNENVKFNFGPYYLYEKSGKWTVDKLMESVTELSKDKSGSVKTHIRRWITEQYNNPEKASQMLLRARTVTGKSELIDKLTQSVEGVCPAYDVVSLYSIIAE